MPNGVSAVRNLQHLKTRLRVSVGRASVFISLCLIALSWLVPSMRVSAQDQTIAQMVHTSWTGRDGAPQSIHALAQTPDGILWIGSSAGLTSFDGIVFTPFKPLSGDPSLPARTVQGLYISKDGDLWVVHGHGGAVRIHQGHVRVYDRVDGASRNTLSHLQQDTNGTMWAVLNDHQLVSLGSDDVWHLAVGPINGPAHISNLYLDSRGTQWVVANDFLYWRTSGQTRFRATGIHTEEVPKLVEAADHTLWVIGQTLKTVAGPGSGLDVQHIDQSARRLPSPHIDGEVLAILPDADGSLWLSKSNEGDCCSAWHFEYPDACRAERHPSQGSCAAR
jgi:ligand-binding sensor domain-containing protein